MGSKSPMVSGREVTDEMVGRQDATDNDQESTYGMSRAATASSPDDNGEGTKARRTPVVPQEP